MFATLAAIRDAVRAELRDAAALNYSDAQLDRAIAAAVDEYGRAWPRQASASITVSGREATLTAAPPAGLGTTTYAQLVRVVAVEHPIGLYPPAYVRFDRWGAALSLQTDLQLASATVKLSLELTHTLTPTESTIPAPDAQLIALGAAGIAQLHLATEAAVTLTMNDDQGAQLRELGHEALERFRRRLRQGATIRQGQLYRPTNPYLSRDIVGFPE